MKLVGMDSSLASRKELATELGYTGDKNDSATMNIRLHKQVLKKLAENGGKVRKIFSTNGRVCDAKSSEHDESPTF